jgi:lysophospholipase L1-like esterase
MKKLIFILLVIASTAKAQQPSILGGFENDVRKYAYRSIDNPPVPGGTLFVGSSSFTLWTALEDVFAPYDAVNRGFGGSQFTHNIAALERIHLPYHPSQVVIFCGTNDIASGKDVETVFQNFKYYISRHWNENPLTKIYFVSLSHAPVREKYWKAYDTLNAKIKELASQTKGLYFIDVVTPMNGSDGKVRESLFLNDRLHPTAEAYDIWAKTIRQELDKQAENYTKADIRKLFNDRKTLGLFDNPQFAADGIRINVPPEEDANLSLVFIGNSITIGGGVKSPPARCAEYLKKQAGIGDVTFSNQGVNGFTTVDFLPSQNKQFPKVVEATNQLMNGKAGNLIFSIMLGTNDSAIKGPNGSPVSPENYRKNIKEIVDELLKTYPDCRIILQRPIWYSTNTQKNSTYLLEGQLRAAVYGLELEALVDFYSSTSAKDHVFYGDTKAYNYFKTHYETAMKHETGGQGTFFLHPNDFGADVLGRFWGAAILDVINHRK